MITPPRNQVSPPLVRGLMSKRQAAEKGLQPVQMNLALLFGRQEGVAREEYQPGPALTQLAGHLRDL